MYIFDKNKSIIGLVLTTDYSDLHIQMELFPRYFSTAPLAKSKEDAQDSELRSVFLGGIQETINCF